MSLSRYPALALAARKTPIERDWKNNSDLAALLLVETYLCVTIPSERSAMLGAPFKSVELGINLKWYKQEGLARNCWARFLMAFALTLARTEPVALVPVRFT